MRFLINSSGCSSDGLLGYYPCLTKYNFEVEKEERVFWPNYKHTETRVYVNIESLEELSKLINDVGYCVIVDTRSDADTSIEIYDTWRE